MSIRITPQVRLVTTGLVAGLAILATAVFAVPQVRELFGFSLGDTSANAAEQEKIGAELIHDGEGKTGLKLTKKAVDGLGIKPVAAKEATEPRPLPPQIGTLNFDNETLFSIPSRFAGEVAEIMEVEETDPDQPSAPKKKRPLRYGDKVKQGNVLAVVHSVSLGMAKAALVDAVCSLRLSQETLDRHNELFAKSYISLATLRQSERQVLTDSNALLSAERTLLIMKLDEQEVLKVKKEADQIAELAKDKNFKRNAKEEAEKWARVEITVPWLTKDKKDPDREFTVVEKNTNLRSMVDPVSTPWPLFRVADLSKLQVWVHPPEEYLPTFRKMLDSPAHDWTIEVQAYPQDKLPPMPFTLIGPSLEPFQHAPMLIGYLDNPKGSKYIVGQFVTATIQVRPEANTLVIPTDALNDVGGEALVFVQPDPRKDEFFLRRVAVVHRFKDVTFVRMELTAKEKELSALEVKNRKRPLEPLLPGERVVTQGVVELTAALEDLRTKEGTGHAK
jgi:cobalt-zinc-cadmium efflux system membrane fusion protein